MFETVLPETVFGPFPTSGFHEILGRFMTSSISVSALLLQVFVSHVPSVFTVNGSSQCSYPDLPFLAFGDFLAFFFGEEFLVFLCVFPFLPRNFRCSEVRKIRAFLVVFLAFFFYQKKTRKGRSRYTHVSVGDPKHRRQSLKTNRPSDLSGISKPIVWMRVDFHENDGNHETTKTTKTTQTVTLWHEIITKIIPWELFS